MEKTLYEDKNVTITNRKITFDQKSVDFVTIRAIEMRQIQDASRLNSTFVYLFAWGLFLLMLDLYQIPTAILFVIGGLGIWWLMSRVWPYVIVADTREGEEIVFSSFRKGYTQKIAHLLADALGLEIDRK